MGDPGDSNTACSYCGLTYFSKGESIKLKKELEELQHSLKSIDAPESASLEIGRLGRRVGELAAENDELRDRARKAGSVIAESDHYWQGKYQDLEDKLIQETQFSAHQRDQHQMALDQLTTESSGLRSQVKGLQNSLRDTEVDLHHVNEQKAVQQENITRLCEDNLQMTQKADSVSQSMSVSTGGLRYLSGQAKSDTMKLKVAIESEFQSAVGLVQRATSRLQAKWNLINSEKKAAQDARDSLNSRLSEEVEAAQAQVKVSESELMTLRKTEKVLRLELSSVRKLQDDDEASLSALQRQLQASQAEARETLLALERAKATNQQNEMAIMQQRSRILEAENALSDEKGNRHNVTALKKELEILRREISSQEQKILDNLKGHKRDLSDLQAKYDRDVTEGRQSNSDMTHKLHSYEATIKDLTEKVSGLESENRILQERATQAVSEVSLERKTSKQEKAKLQALISGLEMSNQSLSHQVNDLANKSKKQSEEHSRLQTEYDQVNSEMHKALKKSSELQEKLDEAAQNSRAGNVDEIVTQMEAMMQRMSGRLVQKDNEIQNLKKTVEKECAERMDLLCLIDSLKSQKKPAVEALPKERKTEKAGRLPSIRPGTSNGRQRGGLSGQGTGTRF